MNTWNQNQNNMINPAPYMGYNWGAAPRYSAAPIHGQQAAWQFPMGSNSEIYLPDADEDIIWWIRTDNNGLRTVQAFDIKPHEEPAPIDTNDLAARITAIEEWINGKQNKPDAKRNSKSTIDNE